MNNYTDIKCAEYITIRVRIIKPAHIGVCHMLTSNIKSDFGTIIGVVPLVLKRNARVPHPVVRPLYVSYRELFTRDSVSGCGAAYFCLTSEPAVRQGLTGAVLGGL